MAWDLFYTTLRIHNLGKMTNFVVSLCLLGRTSTLAWTNKHTTYYGVRKLQIRKAFIVQAT
jgi:hypothetical protein